MVDFQDKELDDQNLKANSELADLEKAVSKIRGLTDEINESNLRKKWEIGKEVNAHTKKYGDNTIQKIAANSGVSYDSLIKACRFNKCYDEEQLKQLLDNNKNKTSFPLSYSDIRKNLTIDAQDFIAIANQSKTKDQFEKAINEAKKKTNETNETNETNFVLSAPV